MTQSQSLQLPDVVSLSLSAQDAVTILGVLQSSDGPYKAVSSIVNSVQQQLMAQAKKPPVEAVYAPEKEFIDQHPV